MSRACRHAVSVTVPTAVPVVRFPPFDGAHKSVYFSTVIRKQSGEREKTKEKTKHLIAKLTVCASPIENHNDRLSNDTV